MRAVTRDGLYEFMLGLKGSAVDVTFGEMEDESMPYSGDGGQRKESKADILRSLKS